QARPYRLYALSNLASMLGLLTYPVLVEPALAVGAQAGLWSGGYALFVLACLGSAWLGWKASGSALRAGAPGTSVDDDSPRPSAAECLLWIGLSATASILLLALTRHLTQDVAPVPFLWVLPLAIYLLTFILCFDAPRYYVRPLFLAALPVALLALDQAKSVHTGVPMLVAVFCVSLFVICMVCHGELVRRKPPVRHLTLFYLMLSLGGVLGGMLVGLVAPAVFTAYFELPIGLFLCAALVAVVLWREASRGLRTALALALVLYGGRLAFVSLEYVQGYRDVVRNFYSQTRVEDVEDPILGPARLMLHGRINHGEQYLSEKLRRVPSAYFCERSGIGRAFLSLPEDRPRKLGVLGLGIGVLAAYGRAGDEMRIYEINEQVLELAQREFTYLRDSPAKIVPILGDGRLMLEREAPQRFDLLVMDAFSGDSVPTHLLTLEAIRTYLGQLNPDGGVLAFNVTNRFLDMRPVLAAAAARLDRVAVAHETVPDGPQDICRRSHWVLLLTPAQAAATTRA
ncbi:MAG TPA: fused MFS/spermidine synthase, partial [Burkholderiaceae bacterium]|nr:fused MFS/spermidine synthase [Burkholderiaceae bacterium]